MALKARLRSIRRLLPLSAALLLAALLAIPTSNIAQAQAPPGNELTLVNADRDFVERKKGGEFVARPVFDRKIVDLFYAVRDADTGDWISAMYRLNGGEKKRSDGWEYSWEYPDLDEHPELDRDRAYLLVMLAVAEDGKRGRVLRRRPHPPARQDLGQDPERPQPGAVGEGLRRLDDRGSPRDPLRRRGACQRRGRRQLPEGVRQMSDILTGTPADLTYAHDLVRQAWMVVWAVTSGALVVILGWMGLSFIMAEHLGTRQAGWREMVPRLVLGLVAAASSLWWCALVLDVADAVSGFIAVSLDVTAGDMLRSTLRTLLTAVNAGSVGMALLLAVLYLVYGFFVLYVIVQMVLRLALIDILLALAPIALGLWILPHTAGWGRHWLRLFMTTVFQQAIQLIALALGFGFLKEFAGIAAFEPVQDLIWKLLMSLAFVYMATRVPSMLGNHGTFDSWLSMLYFGMNLPSSLMRSARTIGLVAGGAAGGPGGMAVGAMAASAGVSAAASGLSSAASMATPSAGGGDGGGEPRSSGE